jgi:molybdenum cofactor synthesis domain-containing protein
MSDFRFAVITVSTSGYRGQRPDLSGPLIASMLAPLGTVIESLLIPDDEERIKAELIRLADKFLIDAVFTTGGTGLSPDDRTPEATLAAADRAAPGISEAMRMKSIEITPRAMLSRGAAVIRGKTLIVNLPGSPKACEENLSVFLPVLSHAISTIRGEGSHNESHTYK